MRTGDRAVCKVAQKWKECPEQAARAGAPRCAWAPKAGAGKCVPFFRKRLGCIFRSRPHPENASRSERGIWDAASAKGRKRKARPILTPDSGSRFPKRPQSGKLIPLWTKIPGRNFRGSLGKRKGPLCRGPSQFKVAGKGIAPALRACGPLRRFRALRAALANAIAFTQLRALTGFDSAWGPHKRKGPLCRGPSQFKVAGKGIEPLTRGFSVLCSTN